MKSCPPFLLSWGLFLPLPGEIDADTWELVPHMGQPPTQPPLNLTVINHFLLQIVSLRWNVMEVYFFHVKEKSVAVLLPLPSCWK